MRKLVAEFIGTLWLVLGGCGSAVLAAGYPELGIGFVGVAIAFDLTVVTMAYAIGQSNPDWPLRGMERTARLAKSLIRK